MALLVSIFPGDGPGFRRAEAMSLASSRFLPVVTFSMRFTAQRRLTAVGRGSGGAFHTTGRPEAGQKLSFGQASAIQRRQAHAVGGGGSDSWALPRTIMSAMANTASFISPGLEIFHRIGKLTPIENMQECGRTSAGFHDRILFLP